MIKMFGYFQNTGKEKGNQNVQHPNSPANVRVGMQRNAHTKQMTYDLSYLNMRDAFMQNLDIFIQFIGHYSKEKSLVVANFQERIRRELGQKTYGKSCDSQNKVD